MGTNETEENGEGRKGRWITRPYLIINIFLCLLMSIAGGSLLGWWLHTYHPTNRQLWMVPFGFVLFLTPIIGCLSFIVPDMCTSKTDEEEASCRRSQHADPVDDSLSDPKRLSS